MYPLPHIDEGVRAADVFLWAADAGGEVRTLDKVIAEVIAELERSQVHGPMHSPHEGWAVIYEELDELWEHVRANTGRSPEAQHEAVQIAAMAIKFILMPKRVTGW